MAPVLSLKEQHWTEENKRALVQSQTFSDVVEITLDILRRMPKPIGWVCGPLANGGVGSLEGNIRVFEETIQKLRAEKKSIFSQMPLEPRLMEIGQYDTTHHNKGAKTALLEGFYLPVFKSGLVETLYFIPDWQSSAGATWEHSQAQRLGLEIIYL